MPEQFTGVDLQEPGTLASMETPFAAPAGHSVQAFGLSMHIGFRITHDFAPQDYSEAERQRLLACLQSAPGIIKVKDITRHPKGGYSVTAERQGDTIEQIVSHFESAGYRFVF